VHLPYTDRRALLEQLGLSGPHWQTPPASVGNGAQARDTAEALQFEGIVMKRLDSTYQPGKRTDAWRKLKVVKGQEFVVGGWLPGKAGLTGQLGSLLVGYYDAEGQFRYAGRVGSGLNSTSRGDFETRLAKLARKSSPFVETPKLPDPHWVTPKLVIEVAFHEWTSAGVLRAPRYKGLRTDKDAREVVRER